MVEAEVRTAMGGELAAVGGLRWDSLVESGGDPDADRDLFAARFAAWAAAHDSSHECFVAVAEGRVVGMMWLATVPRVPSARSFDRASGDLQCAYVVPALRNAGIGGRLIEAVLERAGELELERVTVHSSPRAISVYDRHGFAVEDRLLHVYVAHPHAGAPGHQSTTSTTE